MPAVVNVDGTILPAEQARIPALDHGFLYGDSVYETIRVYSGRPFRLPRHLERLAESARALALVWPLDAAQLAGEIDRTLAAAGEPEAALRLTLSRGAGPIGLDPALCPRSSYLVYARPHAGLPAEVYARGVGCVVARVARNSARALDPAIKSGNFLNNILAAREAAGAGAFEAIMLNAEAHVTEATQSNVFAVLEGRLVTPDLGSGLLRGITRGRVLELAGEAGLAAAERPLFVSELYEAEELFVTSTLKEIVPVTRLGRREVGDGRVGPVTQRLMALYRADVARHRQATG